MEHTCGHIQGLNPEPDSVSTINSNLVFVFDSKSNFQFEDLGKSVKTGFCLPDDSLAAGGNTLVASGARALFELTPNSSVSVDSMLFSA